MRNREPDVQSVGRRIGKKFTRPGKLSRRGRAGVRQRAMCPVSLPDYTTYGATLRLGVVARGIPSVGVSSPPHGRSWQGNGILKLNSRLCRLTETDGKLFAQVLIEFYEGLYGVLHV